jgi:phosphoenolpyruvate carboxylase
LRRDQVRRGKPLWRGSFDETLRTLRAAGVSAAQLQTLFDQLCFTPVFTAHPTEAKRRALLGAQRRVFLTNGQLDNPALNRYQRAEAVDELRSQIQILWQTDEIRSFKPQVRDEIKNGLYYFRESIFQALPMLYRNLERALNAVYGDEGGKAASPNPVSVAVRFVDRRRPRRQSVRHPGHHRAGSAPASPGNIARILAAGRGI